MAKTVIYARVSSKEQLAGSSLDIQESICTDYAIKNDYSIDKIFIEKGESAKTADRTELKALLDYVSKKAKELDAVIIYKVDRLARNTLDYAQLKLFFNKFGVKLISATENLEETPVGRLIENQLAGFAQFDNEIRAERSSGGMITAVKAGRYVWKAPIGYKNIGTRGNSNITPDDPEIARLLRKAWELIDIGYSIEESRRSVTEEGLRNKSNKPISKGYFSAIIKNKVYMGVIESFGLSVIGDFQAIVEPELFMRVQNKLNSKNRKIPIYRKDNEDFPLRGLITCNHCHRYMTASWSKGNGGKFAYYRCSHCHKINYGKVIIEQKFIEYLKKHSYKPKYKEMLIKAIEVNLDERDRDNKKKVEKMKKELLSLRAKTSQIVDKNLQNVISDNVAKELIKINENKISDISFELHKSQIVSEDIERVVNHSLSVLEDISNVWAKSNLDIKKRFQKFLFPSGLWFDGSKFGTSQLSLLLGIKKDLFGKKSLLVTPAGIEPAT